MRLGDFFVRLMFRLHIMDPKKWMPLDPTRVERRDYQALYGERKTKV